VILRNSLVNADGGVVVTLIRHQMTEIVLLIFLAADYDFLSYCAIAAESL
jgi:hypothetical protein